MSFSCFVLAFIKLSIWVFISVFTLLWWSKRTAPNACLDKYKLTKEIIIKETKQDIIKHDNKKENENEVEEDFENENELSENKSGDQ